MSGRRLSLPVLLCLLLAGCGYFNALYNAQRRFAEAERAAREGNPAAARSAYSAAVDKAAASYRSHPTGRWADDALFLIGRARFAMGEHAAARAALARVIEQTSDADMRAGARAYTGAALVKLRQPDSALVALDSAFAGTDAGSEMRRFVRLWRGRARLDLQRADGWEDLAAVAEGGSTLAVDAALEMAVRALATRDSARAVTALVRLGSLDAAGVRADSVVRLVRVAGATWQPAYVRTPLQPVRPRWPAEARTRFSFAGAQLSALAGDTAAAIREGAAAAALSTGQAAADARLETARWQLAHARDPEDLAPVRALLLPAFAFPGPLALTRQLRTLEELLERAGGGQPAALFAAAEYARDVLGAPHLARRLFVAHADVAPDAVSAPKALLAALTLSADESEHSALRARIERYPNNPYVRAVRGGGDAEAYATAEERLARAVAALRADAEAAAEARDVTVRRAITTLDSLRVAARADSLRLSCGTLLDSLGLVGIRGDSVRSACLRSDTAGVARFLAIDTVQLRDTARVDSAGAPTPVPDTMSAHRQ